MSGIVTSTVVAREFLRAADGLDPLLTPLKLMKLVYIAQGWHLAIFRKELVDEEVHAWDNGPVFPELHYAIEEFEDSLVRKVPVTFYELMLKERARLGAVSDRSFDLILAVNDEYWKNSGKDLSDLTHMPDTPWDITCKENDPQTKPVIQRDIIHDYYSKMLEL